MEDGKCKICKPNCIWSDHSNMNFYFDVQIVIEQGRAEKLYEAYINAQSKQSKSE